MSDPNSPDSSLLTPPSQRFGASLLCVGASGDGGTAHPFFGSVARALLTWSRVPVLTVRETREQPGPSKKKSGITDGGKLQKGRDGHDMLHQDLVASFLVSALGLMAPPGVVIDAMVVVSRRLPKADEIRIPTGLASAAINGRLK